MGRPRLPLVIQICLTCGQEFGRIPSLAKRLQYCSRRCYQPAFHAPLEARLWPHIQKGQPDECWPWTAGRDKDGYGKIKVNGYTKRPHRLIWELNNRLLEENEEVCHSCDNPSCCNPKHLFVGSSQDNRDDCVSKKRHAYEERNGGAKLTQDQVVEMRVMNQDTSVRQKDLAARFNISMVQVDRIVNRRSWRHS